MLFLAFEHAARRLGSASSGLDARAPGLPLAQGRSRGRSKTPAVHPTPRGLSCTRQRLAAPGPVVFVCRAAGSRFDAARPATACLAPLTAELCVMGG